MENKSNKSAVVIVAVFMIISMFIIVNVLIGFAEDTGDTTFASTMASAPFIIFFAFFVGVIIFTKKLGDKQRKQSQEQPKDELSEELNKQFIHPSDHQDHTIIKEKTLKCPKCRTLNSETTTYCVKCGERLDKDCPYCFTRFDANLLFCPNCGKRVKKES